MSAKRKYYITTAISYPNGRPHMGHAYEDIATDVIARYHRLAGDDVFFMTGTDEHGLKIAQAARNNDTDPRTFVDGMVHHFKEMCSSLNISHDRFIRTTEPAHYACVQDLWKRMEASGDIYLGRYEGWYSVRDEAYYDESELVPGEGGEKLSPTGTPVEWTVEESYFFRLSKYQQPLLDLYESNPGFIQPATRRNEMLQFVRGGLSDLSISRTSFDWGIPVPGAPGHVMYVWLDALSNYLTGAGYPDESYTKWWPADVHVIGKDVVRFHAVYWPAFLMSAGIAVPRMVFGHGFVLNKGEKMSKSLGNVVEPLAMAQEYGVDQLRYFLIRDVPFGQDGSYSHDAIVTRTNADLANSFGNLAQRTLSQIFKNLDGALPDALEQNDADAALRAAVREGCDGLRAAFEAYDLSRGVETWLHAVFACNAYIDAQEPWKLKKTDPERMKVVLGTLFGAIHDLAVAISPVIPASAAKLLDQMGVPEADRDFASLDGDWYARLAASGFRLEAPQGVFPRYVDAEPDAG
ncbi:methionine--tRNA ligase [Sphingosinicella soli]|uniref:Methionine--tRNA ligase n=1 Tax=Sphingosinicella soli TaxID=333708 RepID=A0A7W7F4R6_9SPHN|nr:methionine--tRNA ligase [Sphingosinicella soli]MBB4630546.1 methionyl-tRNA synthetase [Sphingosinicella soli]